MNRYFITGIGTDVGKTVVSAIVTALLGADYWKPIQAGDLEHSDSMKIKQLLDGKCVIHPEAYRLKNAMSPHAAALKENIALRLVDICLPVTPRPLVIEGAGGLMVPLNETELMIDLIQHLAAEVILVSRNYLGSINHTLLTAEILKQRNIPVKGIVFNGEPNLASEKIILSITNFELIGRVDQEASFDQACVLRYVQSFKL